jgi:hypothetical protein
MDILYEGLGIKKQKKDQKISCCIFFFFQLLVTDSEAVSEPDSLEMLEPDP